MTEHERERAITQAARTLIDLVRLTEYSEQRRAKKVEFELQVELTGGGHETWLISIERTASTALTH